MQNIACACSFPEICKSCIFYILHQRLPLLAAICLYSSASDGLQMTTNNDNISIKIGLSHIQYTESMCTLLSSVLPFQHFLSSVTFCVSQLLTFNCIYSISLFSPGFRFNMPISDGVNCCDVSADHG